LTKLLNLEHKEKIVSCVSNISGQMTWFP